jgi:hypothetical protein
MSTVFGWCKGVQLEKNLVREGAAVRHQGTKVRAVVLGGIASARTPGRGLSTTNCDQLQYIALEVRD